jgi:hypothetical protein
MELSRDRLNCAANGRERVLMEGGQQAHPVASSEGNTEVLASGGGEVAELRPVANLRVCPQCLVSNSGQDAFCTACGTPLITASGREAAAKAWDADRSAEASRVVSEIVEVPVVSTSRRRRWALIVVSVLAVVGLAATTLFALLWRSEIHHATRVEASLDANQSSLRAAQAALALTRGQLAATTSLAARRRAVLLQAAKVLKKVDPLLSDADNIKQITSQIQTARDTFASDSTQMTADLIYLENFEANPQNYPGVDQASLVNQVNGELSTVRYDYAALTASDGTFSTATTTFGGHADAFTSAVRTLQKQLKSATGP